MLYSYISVPDVFVLSQFFLVQEMFPVFPDFRGFIFKKKKKIRGKNSRNNSPL